MRRLIPNALSLTRIPLALVVVLTYKPLDYVLFFTALIIVFIALTTDFLDGALARRWHCADDIGYIVDGLADRAFYVALILTMVTVHSVPLTIAWLLILREILMYSLRLLQPGGWFQSNSGIRMFSLWHAVSIRSWFLTFFLADALALLGQVHLYGFSAYLSMRRLLLLLTLVSGYASVGHLAHEAVYRKSSQGRG